MNNNVYINCISKILTKKWNLRFTFDLFLKMHVYNKQFIKTMNCYKITIRVRNDKKQKYMFQQKFFFNVAHNIILKLFWIIKTNFYVN